MNNALHGTRAPSQPLPMSPLHIPQPQPRQKRDLSATGETEETRSTSRAEGDHELGAMYHAQLSPPSGDRETNRELWPIPPHSTFGQWWEQLRSAFQSADVAQWLRDKGIDTSSITLDPRSGEISFTLTRRLDPQQKRHTVGQDDSHWAAISGPVLHAARVINPHAPFKPPANSLNNPVPAWLIGRFYQEPTAPRNRSDDPGRDRSFKPLDPHTCAELVRSRSENALQEHRAALRDIHDRHTAIDLLRHLATTAEDGPDFSEKLRDTLREIITQDTRVPYAPVSNDKWNGGSLGQFLQDRGWDIPTDREQLLNLANALSTVQPQSPTHGNLVGALAWLDPGSLEALRKSIRAWKFANITLSPFRKVLEYLLDGRPISADEQHNPRRLIATLLDSPRGQALGKAIRDTFEARDVKGSATDWLLAALTVGTTPDDRGETNVEGYQLFAAHNANKSASAIIKGIEGYLLATGSAASPEIAAVRAHLALALRAPEFLVRDIPEQVAVGTHSWVSFATAVARIEAKAPGATATMSYAQVMLQASIAPISDEERQVEYAAQNQAIKNWGTAAGMGYPTTDKQVADVRQAFDTQVKELAEAAATPDIELPMTRTIALEQLKKALPDMDPQLFEKNVIRSQPSNRFYPGPYSILDLFIDGRGLHQAPDSADDWGTWGRGFVKGITLGQVDIPPDGKPGTWVSSTDAIPVNEVLAAIKHLPRPQKIFDEAFTNYAGAVKKTTAAHLKYLVSRLPMEDRKNLEFGKITIRKEIEYHRDDRRAAEGVLLVETERNGNVMTYEIDRLKGTITRRPDATYKERPPRDGLYPSPGKRYDRVKPAGEHPAGITRENTGASGVPNSFSSARTQYIVDTVIDDMQLPAVKKYAQGATTFDTELPTYKIVEQIALNLIPLRSAIQNFKDGKVLDGVVDLAFDIFGFAVGLGAAAKGAKGAFAGASMLSKIGQVGKVVGRATVGALNPLSGVDDLVRGVARGVRSVAGAAYRGVKQLRGSYRNVNLLELAQRPDIAEGTFKAVNSAHSGKALAQYDEARGKWYAFDLQTKQAYGKPLEHFVADTPGVRGAEGLQGIGSANPAQAASQQHGLAATGTFKVGQETVTGNAVMFQGNWHQYDTLKKRAFGPPLKDFSPTHVAASGELRPVDATLLGYEAKYIAPDQLSPKGLQGNIYVGRSKKEYVKVDGMLYESQLKEGQRVILHPAGTGVDIPVRDLGALGWEPAARTPRLLGGASSTPIRWRLGDTTHVVPMDDIKVTGNASAPFTLNYKGTDQDVRFNSLAGAWTDSKVASGADDAPRTYFWRTGKDKVEWQRGTLEELKKAKILDAHHYRFVDITPSIALKIPNDVKPLPKALHYFWAGREIPSHLIENMTRNASQTPGYKSIIHVDADSPEILQKIKDDLQKKAPGLTVMNLQEEEVFKTLKKGGMYDYFRNGPTKNLAAASDVARYPIMNKHGGIYLDTDDLIAAKVDDVALQASADDVLLGAAVVHSLTDYKPFYNTSNFATRPGNPVIDDIIGEMHKRFTTNKASFPTTRPNISRGADGKLQYTPEFNAYERKIFDTVGPNLFNDRLKLKKPDTYDFGLDGVAKDSKLVDGQLVSSGPIVNIKDDVLDHYTSQGIVPPDLLDNQIKRMKEHYFPLRYKFRVQVGADHSWAQT